MRYDKVWNPNLPEMPVDKDGNWLSYPDYGQVGWEAVHQPFFATLKIEGMESGRSAKRVILRDINTEKKYPMFVADLIKCIQSGAVSVLGDGENGYLTANWTGSKRGANYGIKAVK
jgi:hypothetical protein